MRAVTVIPWILLGGVAVLTVHLIDLARSGRIVLTEVDLTVTGKVVAAPDGQPLADAVVWVSPDAEWLLNPELRDRESARHESDAQHWQEGESGRAHTGPRGAFTVRLRVRGEYSVNEFCSQFGLAEPRITCRLPVGLVVHPMHGEVAFEIRSTGGRTEWRGESVPPGMVVDVGIVLVK